LLAKLINGRANNLDLIRFMAATAVLFSHAYAIGDGSVEPLMTATRGQMKLGSFAVSVFFVMSGFLVTWSYKRHRNWAYYFASRALRIFPALFVVVLITVFVLGPLLTDLPVIRYFEKAETYTYLRMLFLDLRLRLPGVFIDNAFQVTVNGSLWTLQYEFVCYLVVGLLGVSRLLRRGPVTLLVLASLLLIPAGDAHLFLFQHFAFGMAVYLYRDYIPIRPDLALLAVIGLVLGARAGSFALAAIFCGGYLVLYLAFAPQLRFHDFGRHGDFSYGLYIWGFLIQQILTHIWGGSMPPMLNFALALPITLGFAALSWHLIEKRALGLKPGLRSALQIRRRVMATAAKSIQSD